MPNVFHTKGAKSDTVTEGHRVFALRGQTTEMQAARPHCTQPIDFGPPFNDKDADVILRSSDNVDFAVHRVFLCKTSPLFKAMLSPQQSFASLNVIAVPAFVLRPSGTKKGLPVIALTERSPILHALLCLILPIVPVDPTTLDEALELATAAYKYQMQIVTLRARAMLEPFLTTSTCLRVFIFAHRLGFRDEMIEAAQLSLKLSFSIDDYDASHPDRRALYNLSKYHEAYAHAAGKKLNVPSFSLIRNIQQWISQHECRALRGGSRCSNTYKAWTNMIFSEMGRMAPEVTKSPNRLYDWRFPILAAVTVRPCPTSWTCCKLRWRGDEVECDLRDTVVRLVNESVLDKVSGRSGCLSFAHAIKELIVYFGCRLTSRIYSVTRLLSLHSKWFNNPMT